MDILRYENTTTFSMYNHICLVFSIKKKHEIADKIGQSTQSIRQKDIITRKFYLN